MKIGGYEIEVSKKNIIIGCVLFIVIAVGWNVFSNSRDVEGGFQRVQSDIKQVGEHQQSAITSIRAAGERIDDSAERINSIAAEIERAEKSSARIETAINSSQSGLNECQERARESAELIGHGKQILARYQK